MIKQEMCTLQVESSLQGRGVSTGKTLRTLIKQEMQLDHSIADIETAIARTKTKISSFVPDEVINE